MNQKGDIETDAVSSHLTDAENQFHSAFQFSAIGMALTTPSGKFFEVNNSFCTIVGYKENELLSRTFQDITYPEDLETDLHLIHELTAGSRQSYQMEKRYIHKDGHLVWALLVVSAVKKSNGEIAHLIKQVQDISDLKAKEYLLEQSENQFRSAFEYSAIGMALANINGQLFQVNNSLCKMIGYSREQLMTHTFQDITHPGDLEKDLHLFGELSAGERESYQMEKRYIHADGRIIWALLAVSAVRSNNGCISHFIKQIQDISEIKIKEDRLSNLNDSIRKTNKSLTFKNEELEQFAFITSHDLQEPLRMITAFLSKIEKRYVNLLDDNGKKYIHFAIDGAQRMRTLILDILAYSTISNNDQKLYDNIDLNVLLQDMVSTNKILFDEKSVDFKVDQLPVVRANKTAMYQLFSNLINNAIKYQAAGNKPLVEIKALDKTDRWEFSVADNGIGIDKRGLAVMFNIFQRLHTAEQYPGTGIGLAICKKIITDLDGEIWAHSKPGVGTIFYFTIPK